MWHTLAFALHCSYQTPKAKELPKCKFYYIIFTMFKKYSLELAEWL
jgi:hypothetical protein